MRRPLWFQITCQYMEFAIISDSKTISPCFSHSLSGLVFIFNNFISLDLFFHGDSGLVRSEVRKSFRILPFVIKINVDSKDPLSLKKRISNNECRILLRRTSVDGMYSIYFIKRLSEAKPSFEIRFG